MSPAAGSTIAGGIVATTKVLSDGHILDISQATPDQVYQGIYTGTTSATTDAKWGTTQTSTNPQLDEGYQAGYVQGGNGGSLAITAPAMALDGTMLGATVAGPRPAHQLPPAERALARVSGPGSVAPATIFPGLFADASGDRLSGPGAGSAAGRRVFALDAAGNPLPLRIARPRFPFARRCSPRTGLARSRSTTATATSPCRPASSLAAAAGGSIAF